MGCGGQLPPSPVDGGQAVAARGSSPATIVRVVELSRPGPPPFGRRGGPACSHPLWRVTAGGFAGARRAAGVVAPGRTAATLARVRAEGSVATARRRKAPVVLLSFPSVLLVVFVASVLTALTAAASPFVSTAAGSEALRNRLAELTPLATGLQIEAPLQLQAGTSASLDRLGIATEADAKRLAATLGEVGRSDSDHRIEPALPARVGEQPGAADGAHRGARARHGDRSHERARRLDLQHHRRARPSQAGREARFASDQPGGGGIVLRVKGIYRALSHLPQSAYWVNLFQDIYPLTRTTRRRPRICCSGWPTSTG